ncbi:FAD-binding and (Fe-S)-binding domain-containing protein [Rhodothermus profundi]|uniref:FAD/FMN-containing dehydrogenase n=1 Tax=Rhodothermus profundi TaxID=633813 RepID=A0A1M6UTL2_9BACT|nr:FAD-binding and (Fe-S)-binding domain-containing protein [Rhodothermus profundi]SHK72532.1 FAD/FMN-containing dehydrogenase [Rhodothermus profundi]
METLVRPTRPILSTERLEEFAARLRPHLRGALCMDPMTRALYATDASIYRMEPVGVLLPAHVDDVQAALEMAQAFGIPVLPRGGGSSLAGQAVNEALVIDFTPHLHRVLEVNPEERWVRVEPGCPLEQLNVVLKPYGLMVGPDPASGSRATLGGMLANNATGAHSILYGNMIRHVRSAQVLLADGTPVRFEALTPEAWAERMRRDGSEGRLYRELDALLREKEAVIARETPRHWRRNSGYRLEYLLDAPERNLAQLLCGSEGTLAVVTELTVNLVPRPKRTALGVVHFHTRDEALRAVTTILETRPSAVELFDGVAIEATRQAPGYAPRLATFIQGDPGAVLITEYFGEDDAELRHRLDVLEATLRRAGQGYAVVRALQPAHIRNVWSVRSEGVGLVMGVKGDYKPIPLIEDAAVPVEHLADYVADLEQLLQQTNTRAVFYAHASAGCLHIRPFINTKDAREVEKMREIATGSMELVKKYGGVLSSEHGDGIVRGALNRAFLGSELYEVYRQLKRIFDPNGLLNPGRIIDTPPLTENLRMGPTYHTIELIEELDWSVEGGFARAVEQCNGNGACRKLESGAMCPSYMATRDERHTTRGRANALRSVMSGALPIEELTGPALYEVMELCVQCKACKTECPSNVDMAKMKTEWLAKYWEANGMPLRARLFAHQPRLARWIGGGWKARLANLSLRNPLVRWGMDRLLGISARRQLPLFAAEPFTQWFRKQQRALEGPTVVLFVDTFNNYHHPEVAQAATEFFWHLGLQVVVPDEKACCGRPLISKGLISEAQQQVLDALERLYPYVEQGWPIVGLEPSCILTFRDELLSLLPGDPRARALARGVLTFEEYVARLADEGRLDRVRWTDAARNVLLHVHCHQKALVGTEAAAQVLSLPPGYTVEVLDTSCCGMAGAFGYEKEHVDISLKMAERRLAPAVRAADDQTLIAAPGTSCRAQIQETTGRRAWHPAEILRQALA